MPESRIEPGDLPLRAVFMLDREVFLAYASYIRRILVGLTGTAQALALVCPGGVDLESILYPSVEWIEHPALRLPIFCSQNNNILLEKLTRFKPTVLHTFHPGLVSLTAQLSHQLDVPYVVTFHAECSQWTAPIASACEAVRLIAPSDHLAARLRTKWPQLVERIEQVHVGTFVEDDCTCFSRSSGVPSLIAMHPLNKSKLFLPLLNAVRHLVLDGHELFVALMGTGKAERVIRAHIRKLGLSSVVTVVPPIRSVRSILSGADIYLHLEDTGFFDAELLEAVATGLAVAGAPDRTSGVLRQGDSVTCDVTDELSVYACLKHVLSNRADARRIAAAAQNHLRSERSVSQMVDRLISVYLNAQRFYKEHCRRSHEEPASAV